VLLAQFFLGNEKREMTEIHPIYSWGEETWTSYIVDNKFSLFFDLVISNKSEAINNSDSPDAILPECHLTMSQYPLSFVKRDIYFSANLCR